MSLVVWVERRVYGPTGRLLACLDLSDDLIKLRGTSAEVSDFDLISGSTVTGCATVVKAVVMLCQGRMERNDEADSFRWKKTCTFTPLGESWSQKIRLGLGVTSLGWSGWIEDTRLGKHFGGTGITGVLEGLVVLYISRRGPAGAGEVPGCRVSGPCQNWITQGFI
jgi:hypothetical protein